MNAAPAPKPRTGLKRVTLAAMLASLALLAGLVVWAMVTTIAAAVVMQGTVAVLGKPKTVQHLDGGIVKEILVADGDPVEPGAVLLRLDSTVLVANLRIYHNRLAEFAARRDRLIAERDGLADIVFSAPDGTALDAAALDQAQDNERAIFRARGEIEVGKQSQLDERILQFRNQIDGVAALSKAKSEQVGFVETELVKQRALVEKGLGTDSQMLALQGQRADLLGQIAEHISETARIENSIRDAELEKLQNARTFKEQAVTELRDVNTQIEELTQQVVATEAQLGRVEIRAPIKGHVHELQVVTVGGVVPPGAVIAQIVSYADRPTFEFRAATVSIDQIRIGQSARLRFPAFNQNTTPEIVGTVTGISPAAVTDPQNGQSYYRVMVEASEEARAKLGDVELVPGMPVEGFLTTRDRTVASYLVGAITEQLSHMFRDE